MPNAQTTEKPKVNPVHWFEIPVQDMARARKFYENVFDFQIAPPMDMFGSSIAFFPMERDALGTGGALIRGEMAKPSKDGVTVYFGTKGIDPVLAKIEKAGGKTCIPRTSIGEFGFFAQFIDTEGNRIGIHEMTGECKG